MPLMIKLNRNIMKVYLCLDNGHFITVDMSVLSEEELNEELEKGYADVQAGRTKNAKTAFDNIRKDYQLNT